VGLLSANTDELVFESLLEIRGEVVTFRDEQTRALINRLPAAKNPPGTIDISTLVGSVVQLAKDANPIQGESIKDCAGFAHRFLSIRFLGFCWECVCETS
jgi:hypothetical protein